MSVSAGKLKISIRARKQPVEKLDIQYYIADRFLKQLKLSEMLEQQRKKRYKTIGSCVLETGKSEEDIDDMNED